MGGVKTRVVCSVRCWCRRSAGLGGRLAGGFFGSKAFNGRGGLKGLGCGGGGGRAPGTLRAEGGGSVLGSSESWSDCTEPVRDRRCGTTFRVLRPARLVPLRLGAVYSQRDLPKEAGALFEGSEVEADESLALGTATGGGGGK